MRLSKNRLSCRSQVVLAFKSNYLIAEINQLTVILKTRNIRFKIWECPYSSDEESGYLGSRYPGLHFVSALRASRMRVIPYYPSLKKTSIKYFSIGLALRSSGSPLADSPIACA